MRGFIKTFEGRVQCEWIDINGHMNVNYYMSVFDKSMFVLLEHIGINDLSIAAGEPTMVGSRIHISHRRELLEKETFEVWTGISGIESKSMTIMHRLTSNKSIRATCDILAVRFSLVERCAVKINTEIHDKARLFLIPGIKDPFKNIKT